MSLTAIRKHSTQKAGQKIDFPMAGEKIQSPQYTLRITAPEGAKAVEIAINDAEWQPCRESVGHWWFDWFDYTDGAYQLIARVELSDGRKVNCQRDVRVELADY